jgi:hypothetical protein
MGLGQACICKKRVLRLPKLCRGGGDDERLAHDDDRGLGHPRKEALRCAAATRTGHARGRTSGRAIAGPDAAAVWFADSTAKFGLRWLSLRLIPARAATKGSPLIGARELDLMKENAILINVARGEIIDEGALYAHLVALPHFFAGIDAWWVEPVRHGRFAMGHPFLKLPNVIGSPHNSAGGGAWRDEYLRRAVQNCRRAILGETPWNLIGPDERIL